MDDKDIDNVEMDENIYEVVCTYEITIYALIHVLNQYLVIIWGEHIERPLTR